MSVFVASVSVSLTKNCRCVTSFCPFLGVAGVSAPDLSYTLTHLAISVLEEVTIEKRTR